MNSTRQTAALSTLIALLLVTSLFAPAVAAQRERPADESADEYTYRVVQGDQEFQVRPIEGDVPVEEFYDYRYPYQDRDNPSWGRSFSSQGTIPFQEDSTSILMLYEGPNGVSLVAVHDKYHENPENGTAGSSVSFQLTGLPEDGEWAVIDDDYGWRVTTEEKDDIFQFDAAHRAGAAGNDGDPPGDVDARMSWVWTAGRSDGMAYRGFGQDDVSLTIDPAFNGNSYHRFGDDRRPDEDPDDPEEGEEYNGTIDDWQFITATDGGEEYKRVWFSSLEQPVRIETVPTEPMTASLSGPEQATVGQNATFTANASTDSVDGYEWTVNGTSVDSTDGPTLNHTFEEAGTAEVNVTVRTGEQRSTASKTVEVVAGESETQATGDSTPGFGAGAAILALSAAVLIATRRAGS